MAAAKKKLKLRKAPENYGKAPENGG